MTDSDECRQAFEKWREKEWNWPPYPHSQYETAVTKDRAAWAAWQAAWSHEAKPAEGWRDKNETAPKDGVAVLTYAKHCGITIDTFKDGESGNWKMTQLVKRFARHDDDAEEYEDAPTHWMPLPPAPSKD